MLYKNCTLNPDRSVIDANSRSLAILLTCTWFHKLPHDEREIAGVSDKTKMMGFICAVHLLSIIHSSFTFIWGRRITSLNLPFPSSDSSIIPLAESDMFFHNDAGIRTEMKKPEHMTGRKRSDKHFFRIIFRSVAPERRIGAACYVGFTMN
jgi:hypothetical protein